MRKQFLQKHRRILYNQLILTGQLNEHLNEIQQTAEKREREITENLLKQSPSPLKSDGTAWTKHMNTIQAIVEEALMKELILN
ncbi:MAG: TnpV protein [Candidatus Ornithomonoglobus sp.]